MASRPPVRLAPPSGETDTDTDVDAAAASMMATPAAQNEERHSPFSVDATRSPAASPLPLPTAHIHLEPNIVVCGDRAPPDHPTGITLRHHHHHFPKESQHPEGESSGGDAEGPEKRHAGARKMVRSGSELILRWQQGDPKPKELGPEELLEDLEKRAQLPEICRHSKRKLSISERTLRVTWAWFIVNMSTGAVASLISQQPYTFNGLFTIGKIFFILNMFLFCVFTALIIARFARKPRALTTSLHHPSESFFFGSFWVAINLLITCVQAYGVPETGPWLVHTLRVVFWTYYAATGLVAVLQYHIIFQVEKLTPSDAMPAWILPAYPFLIVGNLAAAIARTQPQDSAIAIIIGGIAGQGLGWILAFFIYTVYLTRLIHSSMPEPSVRPGMYVSVGPAAYTCAGLLSLGQTAKEKIPPDFLGIESFPVGELWFALSVPVSLFLLLIAVWFSALSTVAIFRHVRQMSFTLQWWSCIFPNAGLAIATIQVGKALDSRGIKIAGSVITVILIPLWIFCAVMHIRAIAKRQLLAPGRDIGVDDVNLKHDIKVQRRRVKKWAKREALQRAFPSGKDSRRRFSMFSPPASRFASPSVSRAATPPVSRGGDRDAGFTLKAKP